jgi:hypothetical protein
VRGGVAAKGEKSEEGDGDGDEDEDEDGGGSHTRRLAAFFARVPRISHRARYASERVSE